MTIPIDDNIHWVGVNDHKTLLFEELWPLPDGISYNAYLILGNEKTALIDGVKKDFSDEFETQLQTLLNHGRKLDYFVINHIEPDHSGVIESLLCLYPDLCVVGNEKTLRFVTEFYRLPVKTLEVKDRETLSLGKHTLEFIMTPMVHWPETMMTYEQTSRILFSGDVFGSFGSLSKFIFDDDAALTYFAKETHRYFSNVLAKYCIPLQNACSKIEGLELRTIAPAHGPVYRKNPRHILNLYSSWSRHETECGAVIVYASMYGHTQRMAEAVAESLTKNGIEKVALLNVSHSSLSFILSEIWRYKGLVLGSCTYNTRVFPPMELVLSMLANYRLENHLLGIFGSHSWGGGAVTALKDFAQKNGHPIIEPVVEAKCAPSDEALNQCRLLGENLARQLLSSFSTKIPT